jgi:hypothetical protein
MRQLEHKVQRLQQKISSMEWREKGVTARDQEDFRAMFEACLKLKRSPHSTHPSNGDPLTAEEKQALSPMALLWDQQLQHFDNKRVSHLGWLAQL